MKALKGQIAADSGLIGRLAKKTKSPQPVKVAGFEETAEETKRKTPQIS
ncbi:hypothetical protein [Comamonas antarctica]|nr:hypothetical protein [Comamonas antarctica]